MNFVRSSVQKSAGFDIKKLSPIAHVDACFIPALFVAGENDQFVAPSHSRKLYEKYAGDKNLVLVEGDHNSPRPLYLFDSIAIFLQTTLQVRDTNSDWKLLWVSRHISRVHCRSHLSGCCMKAKHTTVYRHGDIASR